MNPVELIKRDLGSAGWQRARQAWAESGIVILDESLCGFSKYRIYRVRGDTGQFDFPMLPGCSYGYYAANGFEAVRLTRRSKEIETILAREWPSFVEANPVRVASLILPFYDGGIKASHNVLADVEDLRSLCRPPREYRLDEAAFARALPELGVTSCFREGDVAILRAITLQGWMHDKRNLGVETLTIRKNGVVVLGERRVLAERVFEQVPEVLY